MSLQQENRFWFISLLIPITLAIFVIDTQTPWGIGDYTFYFVPVAFLVLANRPYLPFFWAALVSVLSMVGFYYSPPVEGAFREALLNRVFSLVVIWIVAYLVKRVIAIRNEAQTHLWVKNGQAELAQRIRAESTSEGIARSVMEFLADYTDMKIGACFEQKENSGILKFVAGHGLSADFNTEDIHIGSGLLGGAAQSGKLMAVHEVPKSFFKISSALGVTEPSFLKIIPLTAYGQTAAVLEMGYLKEPAAKVRVLFREMNDMLALAFRMSQNKERLTVALAESQQLTEELQAQQEELRVTNEELEQQSRALKESYARLESQQAEMEQTNQQLEEQTQILENQKSLLDERNRDLIQTQMALVEKTRDLEKASKYKSEFLTNMSHELRTPLNSSLILAQLLAENKEGNLSDEQVKYAQIIHSSGNDLLALINDILDLSKVEAGKMDITPQQVFLEDSLAGLERTFLPLAKQKNLNFQTQLNKGIPLKITTDQQRLEQILKNFLSNAIKFTEKGSVSLLVRSDQNRIFFDVTDTGVGIPLSQQEVIFEAFRQADGTTNRKFSGTGLGLSISKELAQLLGGSIQVRSTEGQGSTFTLTLPLILKADKEELEPRPKEVVQHTPPEEDLPSFSFEDDRKRIDSQSRKILIIEDDEPFAKVLFDLAHEMGFMALVTPGAEEGLKLVEEFKPEAILLDVRLPDHNGLLVLDKLKSQTSTRHIPVHIISSSDFSKAAYEMGAIGYMLKPVKREEIIEAMSDIAEKLNQKMKKVLVIQGNPSQRDEVRKLIEDQLVKVETVSSGKEALDRLTTQTYDCMIMDLNLPDMAAVEFLEDLTRPGSIYSYPPVIIYTQEDIAPQIEEELRKWSGSIIIKGARSPERLLNEVTLFLHKVETELPLERQKMLQELRHQEKTLEARQILVVDDDIRNIFALTSALEHYGAIVTVARNGKEALNQLHSGHEFDIVLMDIMMPEMDGYEAISIIRQDNNFKDLPILALTAKAMKDDQEKCLSVGANDYLAKPLDMGKLVSLIRVWLPRKRSFTR